MKVKLVSMTKPIEDMSPQEYIAYVARVSNPSNQNNHDTSEKLLQYCFKNKHFSVFEMFDLTFEIEIIRDIGRQILRHRSFSFQEFCLSGDTLISFDLPNILINGRRQILKQKISKLYERQEKGLKIPSCIRVYDENKKEIVNSKLLKVFKTGVKPLYKIELFNGKIVETTKEHKFLTEKGFLSLEEAVGLSLNGETATMTNSDVFFACNGIPSYQNYDWLKKEKENSILNKTGVYGIAKNANVSYHTIRKWLKKLNLSFTKKEVSEYSLPWNKGKFGYNTKPHKIETIEKMRKKSRKGSQSNLWKGGVDRSERLKISDWCYSLRSEFLINSKYECQRCKSNKDLELHHIKTVAEFPEFAYDKNNIEVICRDCHLKHHSLNGDRKVWRKKSKGNKLSIEWCKIKKIEYVGEKDTYDLEVEHDSHNYVANGIIVHNSQRYAKPTDLGFEYREARLQDKKNRQNSVEVDDPVLSNSWENRQWFVINEAKEAYNWAIENGIAKEQARAVLPEGLTLSKIYMKGSLRSFIHYCQVRMDKSTQKEHRLVAEEIWKNIIEIFPFLNNQ